MADDFKDDIELLSGAPGTGDESTPGITALRKAGTELIGDPAEFVRRRDEGAQNYSAKIDEAIRRLRAPPDDNRINIPLLKVAAAFLSPTKTGAFSESLANAGNVGAEALGKQRDEEDRRASQADNLELQRSQFLFRDTTERMQLGNQLLNAAEQADARRLQALARSQGPFGQIIKVLEAQGIKPDSPEGRRALKAYGNRLIYGESAVNRRPSYSILPMEETNEKGERVTNLYRYNAETNEKKLIGTQTLPSETNKSPVSPTGWVGDIDAEQIGVPILGRDPFAVYTDPKARAQAMRAAELSTEREYRDLMKKINYSEATEADIERAMDLLKSIPKGEIGGFKGKAWATAGTWGAPSNIQEFDVIVNRLTPFQRAPGSGSTSDFDAKMFKAGLFGIDKSYETNMNILVALKAQQERNRQYAAFMHDYKSAHKTLQGAEARWKEYLKANPIFDPSSTQNRIKINENRQDYRDYFREYNQRMRTPVKLGD